MFVPLLKLIFKVRSKFAYIKNSLESEITRHFCFTDGADPKELASATLVFFSSE